MDSTVAAGRKHFAAGDFLSRFSTPDPYELLIEAAFVKPGWKRRMTSDDGETIFPGSAILFEDRYYEILEEQPDPNAPSKRNYYLKSWETRFPIRVQFLYTPEECLRLVEERKAEASKTKRTALIRILLPLFGLLPASDQQRLAQEYGIRATQMTFSSAFLLFIFGGYSFITTVASMINGGASSFQFAGCYFFAESLIRVIQCWKLDEPVGTLPVVLLVELLRAIKRPFASGERQRSVERMDSRHSHLYQNALDEVREGTGDWDLEVISDLPKPHWNPLTGISYNETWYGLIDTKRLHEEKKVRYRFRLKKAKEGIVFRSTTAYTPEEIRNLYRQKRHQDLSTWVETFCLLWSLLPQEDQLALQESYEYDAVKYTRWTSAALGIFGTGSLIASIASLSAGFSVATELLWLLFSGFLVLESASRWTQASKDKPEGSILGILLRPFARRFMEY